MQVQIGTHSFTFDHVYGSTGTPSSSMFEECVAPLVEGLFQGYNATVLAYGQVSLVSHMLLFDGANVQPMVRSFLLIFVCSAHGQTGSGKTYTMGTGFKDGSQTGLIPQVMNTLFSKMEALKQQTEFQLHVSFIEVSYFSLLQHRKYSMSQCLT